MTQVEAIAKYAARASFDDLSAESRRQLPIHILDSLSCSIAALGADSRFHCRAQRFPHPSVVRALSFPAWSRIRRRRAFCLRNRACIRQDQSQPKRPALRIPEEHHATRSRPGWFAMDRLWQSGCQRSCIDDRHSNNADCDHVCLTVRDRTG